MNPVPGRVFGAALGLLVLIGFLACFQLLEGQALLSGLAEMGGSRTFGGLGLVERAFPMEGRAFHSPRQNRAQPLPIAFVVKAIGDKFRRERGRATFRLLSQRTTRLFGCGIQALLLRLGTQAGCCGLSQGFACLLLCAAAQAQQDSQVGCHGC